MYVIRLCQEAHTGTWRTLHRNTRARIQARNLFWVTGQPTAATCWNMQKLKRILNQRTRPESRTLTELICVLTLNFTARSLHDNSLFLKWSKQIIKGKETQREKMERQTCWTKKGHRLGIWGVSAGQELQTEKKSLNLHHCKQTNKESRQKQYCAALDHISHAGLIVATGKPGF